MHTAFMDRTSYEANDLVAKLAEESAGGMAETAEAIGFDDRRKETKPSAHDHFSWTMLSSGTPSGESNARSLKCLATRRR